MRVKECSVNYGLWAKQRCNHQTLQLKMAAGDGVSCSTKWLSYREVEAGSGAGGGEEKQMCKSQCRGKRLTSPSTEVSKMVGAESLKNNPKIHIPTLNSRCECGYICVGGCECVWRG